jgi:ASC-1-like (ASCH) protein
MKKILFGLFLFALSFNAVAQKSNKAKIQAMYNAIKDAGIKEPDYVIAQCIQETGWLNCKQCCLRYYNLFGFYKNNKCKKFDSEADCIEYYKHWQHKRYGKWREKNPNGSYFDFLHYSKYATGAKYTAEVKPKLAWVRKNLVL